MPRWFVMELPPPPHSQRPSEWFDADLDSWGSMGKIGAGNALESWLFEVRPCSRFSHLPYPPPPLDPPVVYSNNASCKQWEPQVTYLYELQHQPHSTPEPQRRQRAIAPRTTHWPCLDHCWPDRPPGGVMTSQPISWWRGGWPTAHVTIAVFTYCYCACRCDLADEARNWQKTIRALPDSVLHPTTTTTTLRSVHVTCQISQLHDSESGYVRVSRNVIVGWYFL